MEPELGYGKMHIIIKGYISNFVPKQIYNATCKLNFIYS